MVQKHESSRKKVGQKREKVTANDQIGSIEKEIRETPYHKGTERHIGLLRAKLARLRDQEVERAARKKGRGGGYAVKKQGDATVVLVGPPSVGKSTLLNKLTNAQSKVAPYSFTTVSVIPGMMKYKNAYIQILDVPGLIQGAEEGKGRGREVLSVVRGADLLVLMVDRKNLTYLKTISDALERNGIRINKRPSEITIDKRLGGGIIIHSNIKQDIGDETIKEIANQYGVKNAEIALREKITIESFIDALSKNRVYIPAISIVTKADEIKNDNKYADYILISAEQNTGLEMLRRRIWEILNFKTVYLVRLGEKPNEDNPLVIRGRVTLKEIAESIGSEFSEFKKKAKIWGPGAKFPGQEVSLTTEATDGMEVMFV